MNKTDSSLVMVGTLNRAHGIRGEIKMYPETDDVERFKTVKQVWVGRSLERLIPLTVETVRVQIRGDGLVFLVKFAEYDQREEVDLLKNREVYAREADLPALGEDEWYVYDLIGFKAVLDDGTVLGTVVDWLEMPAHPVFVVETGDDREVLVPDVPEFVLDVDAEKKLIVLDPVEGLF